MRDLRQQFGVAALALEFTILTGARTGEVIGATWDEMDLGDKVWTIPAGRMKKNDEKHRVPMCDRAVVILKEMHAETIGPYVFPGLKRGKPLSNMAMAMTLERMGRGDVTVHGFRSTFRDWAGEETDISPDVCEAALAHKRGKTHAAYQRGDLFKKREKLMRMWGAYCQAA